LEVTRLSKTLNIQKNCRSLRPRKKVLTCAKGGRRGEDLHTKVSPDVSYLIKKWETTFKMTREGVAPKRKSGKGERERTRKKVKGGGMIGKRRK